jgi:hypothetical protein
MRIPFSTALAATLLASTIPATAQEAAGGNAHTANSDFHIGIGAGLSLLSPVIVAGGATLFAGPFGGGSLVIPLDIAGVVRIEPEVAIFHYSEADNVSADSATSAKVGVGIFYMFGIGGDAQGTIGARLGPQFVSVYEERDTPMIGTTETTRSSVNFAAGPAFGGEYFPSEYFSVGAEAQLNFIYLGEEKIDIDPGPDPGGNDRTGLAVHTNALIYARAFFL